ncbi:MAG: hypothetical protein ACRC6V_01570 [Bacteroidales bacterium]
MKDLLRNSMLALYRDNDVIYDALSQLDWTAVQSKFEKEVFCRIDKETFYKVDEYLRGDEYMYYKQALDEASMAVTSDLSQLIEFTLEENNGGVN